MCVALQVDAYSFGLTLLEMAVHEPLLDFIGGRWALAKGKKSAPKQAMRFIRSMTEDGWRPVTAEDPVIGAPPAVVTLAMRCCSQDPAQRPSFAEVLEALDGPCNDEISAGAFARSGPANAASAASPPLARAPAAHSGATPGAARDLEAGAGASFAAATGGEIEVMMHENPMISPMHENPMISPML